MSAADFQSFIAERTRAAEAYVRGDGKGLDGLVPHDGTATFFGPQGGAVVGADAVARRYLSDVKAFRPSGTTRFEILSQYSDGTIGFWCGFQIARVQIGETSPPTDMKLRITEVFRRTDDGWKLVHRHADMAR
jgi:ketosteroid isomerase-like protein